MATDWPIVFNLVNCIIGVSVLAMPFCFHECGIILGPLLMITSGFLTKCSCELLLKGAQVTRKRSYELLALHTYGMGGKLAVQASIIGLLIGTLIAFNVIIGDLAPSIFQGLSGVQTTSTIRAVIMLLMSLGVALPLCMMRNVQSLAAFSSLALIFYFGFVCQMLFTSLPNLVNWSWTGSVYYWRPLGILSCLPIFSLAFACQTQLFVLYDSLPEPSVKRMQNVVNTAMNIVSLIYFLVGVLGYICFYNVGIKGDILTNYGNGFVVEVIKCGFMFSVLVSFPLMMFPVRESINNLISIQQTGAGVQDNVPSSAAFISHNRFVYITVSVLVLTLTVGILLPNIEFVLALTGATMGTLIAFIYPASMYLHVVHEQTSTRLKAKIIVVVGLVCLIGSTYAVLTSSNNHEHQVKNIHPPVDPIKPVPGQVNSDPILRRAVNPPKIPEVKEGALKGVNQPGKPTQAIVANPQRTVERRTLEKMKENEKRETKSKKLIIGGSREEGAEKDARKEPPVPNALDKEKKLITDSIVKPDGRVLMSQSELKEKGKENEETKENIEKDAIEKLKENLNEVDTDVSKNLTKIVDKVVEKNESKPDESVKRLLKRDLSAVAAIKESSQNSSVKTEHKIDSLVKSLNNDTPAKTRDIDTPVRKPARDLKSSDEIKKELEQQDTESKDKPENNTGFVISRGSQNLKKLLDKRAHKSRSGSAAQKALAR